ncbi:MAG TPA: hypothetical protein VJ740_11440, partial [Hyphomicrobiaceae bacterium]|nr:hypothetical protein [Hyphomicrobiaceae bacterium]
NLIHDGGGQLRLEGRASACGRWRPRALSVHAARVAAPTPRRTARAVALQFPFGHHSVASVIPGPVTDEEVGQSLAWVRSNIPPDLWDDLKREGLIRQDAPTPGSSD